jgi:hypothetical protein
MGKTVKARRKRRSDDISWIKEHVRLRTLSGKDGEKRRVLAHFRHLNILLQKRAAVEKIAEKLGVKTSYV